MKFRIKWLMLAIATVAMVFLLTACVTRATVKCAPPVVQKTATDLSINLYLDGTPSMEGFVDQTNSQYIRWINRLDTILQNNPVGFDTQPHRVLSRKYFRLGSQTNGKTSQTLNLEDYGDAIERSFYNGQGAKYPSLNVSEIDTAIVAPKGTNELTIVVTDLYQAKDNINKVVNAIKASLTSQSLDYAIGVIGIKSEFNGRVYTEGRRTSGDFLYNSKGQPDRPFYILSIGQVDDLSFYFKKLLDGQSSVGETVNAVIYSPRRLVAQPFTLDPVSNAELPTALQVSGDRKPKLRVIDFSTKFGNMVVNLDPVAKIQGLGVEPKSTEFGLASTANWVPIPYAAPWEVGNALSVKLVPQSFDRTQKVFADNTAEPTLKEALRLGKWQQKDQTLTFVTQFLPAQIRGNGIYLFQAEVSVKPDGNFFANPSGKAWWQTWSSEPDSQKGSQTHNLDRFMDALQNAIVNVMQEQPPTVGRFCYLVQKG
jgi:hypothetical protein